jgi:hypothetical protein
MIKKLHYAYVVCLWLLLLSAPQTTRAQTTLVAGDIAILGWNSDETYPNQRWAFMAMRNIAANTVIIFTDNGYDGSISNFRTAAGNSNDGYLTWTVQSPILKGTVIYATNNTVNSSSAGVSGQLGQPGPPAPGFGFAPTGDQIIVYQGTSGTAASATFIYALNTGQNSGYGSPGNWITTGSIVNDQLSYIPPGLINGSTAVALTSNGGSTPVGTGLLGSANYGFDNMYYAGTTSGYRSALLTAIATPTNWIGHDATTFNLAAGGVYPTNSFNVLPVTLVYFTAQAQAGETVQLAWGTAMESNNDHFTIERSADGSHFNIIGTLPGKGDYNEPADYSFIDHAPDPGSNYYRLSQTDRDGKEKILGLKSVTMQDIGLRVGPNPAVHFIDVSFNRGAWREMKLYNSAEQLLQTIPLTVAANRTRISLQNYRPGTYYLALMSSNGKSNTVRRVVKIN